MSRRTSTESSAKTSLLENCLACKSECCRGTYVTASAIEHKEIIASGAPDYFYKITIPQGDFYYLDYKKSDCPYLKSGKCSIENVKPDTCKSFPVRKDEFGGYEVAGWCPAKIAVAGEYIENAKKIVDRKEKNINVKTATLVCSAFLYSKVPQRLQAMQATVTPPPDLKAG